MKELKIIEEREVLGKEFRIYGTIEEPLFLAKDVAEWIEYSKDSKGNYNVSVMLSKVGNDEKLMCTVFSGRQKREMWFLTEDGLYRVLSNSRKTKAKELLEAFKEEIDYSKYKNLSKQLQFEILLDEAIENHLEGFDWDYCPFNNKEDYLLTYNNAVHYETEYRVPNTNYRVDFYFPKFNLIIEYDEKHHKQTLMEDARREAEICNALYDGFGIPEVIRVEEGEEFKGIIKVITTLSRVFVS